MYDLVVFIKKEGSMNNGTVPCASSKAIEGTSTWSSSSLYTSTTCKRQSHQSCASSDIDNYLSIRYYILLEYEAWSLRSEQEEAASEFLRQL